MSCPQLVLKDGVRKSSFPIGIDTGTLDDVAPEAILFLDKIISWAASSTQSLSQFRERDCSFDDAVPGIPFEPRRKENI